ncbi:Ran-specific GTPase-activating protein 1 [Elysia marginata]|uniref:Ran-specific GTPase-activating protein 1 n=1 Tax=Elysia marginata TaxID=1093978 RepID=A0AAV4JI90_9GAST|nr:Ran-specific GTPase-activating protein 1 [Elysia marginata]
MGTVFWDSRGVLLFETLQPGETINAARYCQTLDKLKGGHSQKAPMAVDQRGHFETRQRYTPHSTSDARRRFYAKKSIYIMAKSDEKEHTETKVEPKAPKEHTETEAEPESPEVHFEPIVKLSLVDNKTLEEDEDVLLSLRARLYRYDREAEPVEWKERGTGDCRILKHKTTGYIRILMRRDKTLKICANHYIYPIMELKPNCGSDRAWVWTTQADFADEEAKEEVLAIRFGNAENAQKFKSVFEESKQVMEKLIQGKDNRCLKNGEVDKSSEETKETASISSKEDKSTDGLSDKLEDLKVSETEAKEESTADEK